MEAGKVCLRSCLAARAACSPMTADLIRPSLSYLYLAAQLQLQLLSPVSPQLNATLAIQRFPEGPVSII